MFNLLIPKGGSGSGSSPLTTKGDLYTYSSVAARLAVGTDGQFLSADSSTATGLKWVDAAGAGTVTTSGSPANTYLAYFTGATAITGTSAWTNDGSVLLGPAGAVTAPPFSFTADPNTGMYRVGADILGFAAGGALIGYCEANGLGILAGSTSSTIPLAVRKDANTIIREIIRNSDSGSSAKAQLSLQTDAGDVDFLATSLAGNSSSPIAYLNVGSSFTGGLRLDVNGTNPFLVYTNNTARLTVAGAGTATFASGTPVVLSDTTDSTTSTTGSLKTAGGLGVAKAVNIGTTLTVTGATTLTGAATVTGGIVGTTAAGNATAGNLGEYVESVISTDANLPAANGVWGDATSISLTAGDWDVCAMLLLAGQSGTTTAGDIGIGTASGTSTTGLVLGSNWNQFQFIALNGSRASATIPPYRVNISGTTTYYLKVRGTFTSTPTYTCRFSARRVR